MSRAYTITNKWCVNQKVSKPVIFLRGLESSSLLRRNHGWANTKAIVISRTMTTPVQPSVPFTNHQNLTVFCLQRKASLVHR
nr:hypothetical protein SEVIR_6G073950v2 [Setaria viridis]